MTIQTSSSNKNRFFGCFKEAFIRNKSIGIFYFCLSFIFLPAQFILTLQRYKTNNIEHILSNFLGPSCAYTNFSSVAFLLLTIAMTFAAPIIMFSYMQNKRAVDVYHSLPYTRNELLGANILSGILYIMIPIAINFSIIAAVSLGLPGGKPLNVLMEIFYWFPTVMGIFSITTLVCVLVGTTFDSFLFAAGLHVTPIAIWALLNILSVTYLLGFSDSFIFNDVSILSPAFIRIPYFIYKDELPSELFVRQMTISVVWVFISLAVFALAFYCYNKRKSEQAETATEKGVLSTFLRLVGTAGGGILLATIFSSTLLYNGYYSKSFLIWTFVSSLIVYLVGDVIISKRIRNIKKAVLPGAIFSLAVVLLVSCYFFDITGYSKKLPAREEIVSVSLVNYSHNYSGRFENQPNLHNEVLEYTSPEVIDAVLDYHKAQTDAIKEMGITKARNIYSDSDTFYFSPIEYKLSSGKTMKRAFTWSLDINCADSIYKLETSTEFIEKNHPIFKMNENSVIAVNTINLLGSHSESLNLSSRETAELIAALQQDMLSDGGRDIINSKPLGKVIFLVDNIGLKRAYNWDEEELRHIYEGSSLEVSITVTDAFKSTISLFEKLGKSENFENDLDTIYKAYVNIPTYSDKAIEEINYNTASSIAFRNNEENEISIDELKKVQNELRGIALKNTPYVDIFFVSDAENLNIIENAAYTKDEDVVVCESSDKILPNDTDDSKTTTGMAFVPYEKLTDNLKVAFLKSISSSGAVDIMELLKHGMTYEFYEVEMAKYSNLL